MISSIRHGTVAVSALLLALWFSGRLLSQASGGLRAPSATPAALLYSDNFRHGLGNWSIEMQTPGKVSAANGVLSIDVPAGVTIWFKHELHEPLMIEYEATMIRQGGPNDRVSDLNCFWMATNPQPPHDPTARPRTGKFADYNTLLTYYVGLGGNGNTTTRFRRYIGDPLHRPLRPEDDRSAPGELLKPNQPQTIRLIARGNLIEYDRDRQRIFRYIDPHPYTHGWFAFRTTKNHMTVRHFRVYRLAAS